MNIEQARKLKIGDSVEYPNESFSKDRYPWLKGTVKQGAGSLPDNISCNGTPYVYVTIGVSVWPSNRLKG